MSPIQDFVYSTSVRVPTSISIVGVAILLLFLYKVYVTYQKEKALPNIPIAKLDGYTPQASWYHHGSKTIREGMKQYPGIFQVVTAAGPRIVLRNEFSEDVRKNEEAFSFNEANKKDFFAEYHGFDGFRGTIDHPGLVPEMIRTKLTQSLGLITDDLVEETTDALSDNFGESKEWKEINVSETVLETVARLSSRVFLGKDLCRDRKWLDITKTYTINVFLASRELREVPAVVRPLYQWFNKRCKSLREQVKDAQELIHAEVERRKVQTEKAIAAGGKAPKIADTIGWLVETASRKDTRYSTDSLVGSQLGLSLAAIHTTTLTISWALLDIVAHPEIVQPLRDEIVSVIRQYGMSRETLYKLRLMDSFLKESQRFFIPAVMLNRELTQDYQLPDGTVLRKGNRIMVETTLSDPKKYPDPQKFDAGRFLCMREKAGEENKHQFVSLSADNLSFGYGTHACPGRFFVSNEIKIALCHLLLKYDFAPQDDEVAPVLEIEGMPFVNPGARIKIRRRQEEIMF